MARKRKIPPTRFPHALAASYARALSALIQRMHSIAYEAFRSVVAARAVEYRKESSRIDATPIDDILAALQWARRRSENGVYNTASLNGIAQRFVQGVSFFNRSNINDQLRVKGIDPTTGEPWLDAFVRASVQENVTLIKSIEQDYFKRVESIILQGVKNGQSIPDIASAIKGTADISYNKAKFIARDQTGSIIGQMTAKRHQAAGAPRFQWSTSGDRRVREEHAHFDGKVYYYSEGAGPRRLLPGQDFNCRCVAYPIFEDDDVVDEMESNKQPESSSKIPDDGTMDLEKQFRDLLDEALDMTSSYKKVLINRYQAGSDQAKRVFVKYVKGNKVRDSHFSGSAHYNPELQEINMKFTDDLYNPRGDGATFFHEHGHLVDNFASIIRKGQKTYEGVSHTAIGSIGDRDFYKAILDDIQNYIERHVTAHNLSRVEAQAAIKQRFSQADSAIYSAVSDIYGGATGNKLRGHYGHSKEYWRQLPNALEKEAFAHMFEASFDPSGKRLELIKEYLPDAYELFQNMMEEI